MEGDANYTWLHATNRPKCLCALTLKRVEVQLPGFIRIHKSSLINPIHVAQVRVDGPYREAIHLTNGLTMLVARRRIQTVRQQLNGQG